MKYLLLVLFLIPNVLLADASIEDYRKYNTTKTKFNLQKTAKGLENPWALTFIDKKNIVVTEKDGGLYRINVLTGEKQKIKHNIQHIGYDGSGQGGLLDVYFNPSDGYIYFSYSHKSTKFDRSKQPKSGTASGCFEPISKVQRPLTSRLGLTLAERVRRILLGTRPVG